MNEKENQVRLERKKQPPLGKLYWEINNILGFGMHGPDGLKPSEEIDLPKIVEVLKEARTLVNVVHASPYGEQLGQIYEDSLRVEKTKG